jgi:ubiquinone/menaquinone biosynthesis C-methylase UbiE
MNIVRNTSELESAQRLMYDRLADFLVENLDLIHASVILEAGCGGGRLTMPFVEKVMRIKQKCKIIAFDISSGPYLGRLNLLKEKVRGMRFERVITTIEGDVKNMEAIDEESVDLIISNELFCDLDRQGLEMALKEFFRILKPNGQMAHGVLSPVPENEAQKLLIEADSYSLEKMEPKPSWFSPPSDEVAALMQKIGFRKIVMKYFEPNLKLGFKAALEQLNQWNTDPAFVQRRRKDIQKHGLEFPMEYVIFCEKPS